MTVPLGGCVKPRISTLRNAKQFRCERSRHRPVAAHRLFVKAADSLMGCGERPLDAIGKKADEREKCAEFHVSQR